MEYQQRLPVACPQHPERSLELLCCNCDLAMCWKCLVADHGPHRIRDLAPRDLPDSSLRVPGGSRMNSYFLNALAATTTTTTLTQALSNVCRDYNDARIPLYGRREELLSLDHADFRREALVLLDEMDAFEHLDAGTDALREVLRDISDRDSLVVDAIRGEESKKDELLIAEATRDESITVQAADNVLDGNYEPHNVGSSPLFDFEETSCSCEKETPLVGAKALSEALLGTDNSSLITDDAARGKAELDGMMAGCTGKSGLFEEADTLRNLFPDSHKDSLPQGFLKKHTTSLEDGNEALLYELDALVLLDKITALRDRDDGL